MSPQRTSTPKKMPSRSSKLVHLAETLFKVLAIGLLAPAVLLGQDDAAQLLKRVSDNYKSLKSYHFELESQSEMTTEFHGSWDKSRTTLIVASPERVRFENSDNSGSYVVVSDGKTLWRATGITREYSRSPVSGPVTDIEGGGREGEVALRRLKGEEEDNWSLDRFLKSAQIVGEEKIKLEGHRVRCTVVRAKYELPALNEGMELSITRTFWIDKQRLLLLQEETVETGNMFPGQPFEQGEDRHKIRYTFVSVGEPLADSLFTYTPPDNFREVDTLEPPRRTRPTKEFVGKPAPDLSAKTLDGTPITLSSLHGKPVLLDFWATWCAPCRELMPTMAKLYGQTKDQGLILLGVDDDPTPQKAAEYLKTNHYIWPSLFDGDNRTARTKFKVTAIPTLVLIDKDGTVIDYEIGQGRETEASIRSALEKLGFRIP